MLIQALWLVSIYGGKFLLVSSPSTCMLFTPACPPRKVSFLGARKVSGSAGSTWERVYVGIILGNGVRLTYGVAPVLTVQSIPAWKRHGDVTSDPWPQLQFKVRDAPAPWDFHAMRPEAIRALFLRRSAAKTHKNIANSNPRRCGYCRQQWHSIIVGGPRILTHRTNPLGRIRGDKLPIDLKRTAESVAISRATLPKTTQRHLPRKRRKPISARKTEWRLQPPKCGTYILRWFLTLAATLRQRALIAPANSFGGHRT